MMVDKEPLIYTEQGVVYLFSRYWKYIPEIKRRVKEIIDTHTKFPDFIYETKSQTCGLEFENKLSGFRKHIKDIKRIKKEEGITSCLVIYWLNDDDQIDIEKEVKSKGAKIKFICLKDYFILKVKKKRDKPLNNYLSFNRSKRSNNISGAYSFSAIEKEYRKIKHLTKEEYAFIDENRYRVLGHNIGVAGGVDIKYWKYIHLYTTTGSIIAKDKIPKYILFMDENNEKIVTIIEPKIISSLYKNKMLTKPVREFYDKFYFFDPSPPEKKKISKLIIYDKITNIKEGDGKNLFNMIKGKKKIQQNGFTFKADKNPRTFKKVKKKLEMVLK